MAVRSWMCRSGVQRSGRPAHAAPNATGPGLGDDLLARDRPRGTRNSRIAGLPAQAHRATVRTNGHACGRRTGQGRGDLRLGQPGHLRGHRHLPGAGRSEVNAAVERAREAASWWAGLDWKQRQTRLLAWKSHITRYIGRLAELVHNETGKPLADAQLEILLAIVHIDWAAKNARRVLGPRRVRSGLIALNQASCVEYAPLGVIGVIGPWNYPVFTPMGSHRLRARRGQRGGVQAERAHPRGRRLAGQLVRRGRARAAGAAAGHRGRARPAGARRSAP